MTLETVKEGELYKLLLKTIAVSYTICVYSVDHQKLISVWFLYSGMQPENNFEWERKQGKQIKGYIHYQTLEGRNKMVAQN